MNHATPKPVALWDKPIDNHTRPSEIIYEPFAGSGTQIIAAEMKARRCFAIELDPANSQVCVERWSKFSGQAATLDGIPFDQVAKDRTKGRRHADQPGKRASVRAARSGNGLGKARLAGTSDA